MPDWNVAQGLTIDHEGVSATGYGTSVNASATPNVKGSYVEIIASTTRTASWLIWHLKPNTGGVDYLVDLAIGAAGSEQVIVPNLLLSTSPGSFFFDKVLPLPLYIPSGTRLALRSQSSTASASVQTSLYLGGRPFPVSPGFGVAVDYGTATADSGGTSIDPGAVANTKGSWTQIVASTTRLHRYLVVAIGSQLNADRLNAQWLIDVGVGAGGSEQVLIPNIYAYAHSSADLIAPALIAFPVMIPAGTRLAVRAQCQITDATDRLFDIALYGV